NIGMFHIHGVEDGTLMNSAGGKLTPKDHKNLADLLAEMKHIGFPEVVITMNPEGANLPTNTDYDPSTYDENFSFLKDIRSVAVASGEPYTIDLYDEGIPENDPNNPGQVNALNYSKRLWADYTKAFGKADTTGFSIIGGDPLRFASLSEVYQGNPPDTMNLHFYGNTPTFKNSEHDQFVTAHQDMHAAGFDQPWIIGETFYNDPTSAQGIRQAMAETGQPVRWVSDWQLTRANKCDQVDVAPPTDYSAFADAGFDPLPSGTPDAVATTGGKSVVSDVLANDKPGAADLPLEKSSLQVRDPATGAWTSSASTDQGSVEVTAAQGDARAAVPQVAGPGELRFTPAEGFSGRVDPITYRAADSQGDLYTSTLTVTVKAAPPATTPPTSAPPSAASPSSAPPSSAAPTAAPTTSAPASSPTTENPPASPRRTAMVPVASDGNQIDSGLGAGAGSGTHWSRLAVGLAAVLLAAGSGALLLLRRRAGRS
ncbi:MAG TPA: hypothetical protein VHC49_01960, partial [Mycobacteriales bacterium]|nr:hypothetical protein [Mycobacteriales bacterium]